MAVYAIGDIQGCYAELMALLKVIEFDEATDQLWFTGDLVNRGPDSLGVLRFVRGLGLRRPAALITVLGNHDLHLLAVAEGLGKTHRSDTLDEILTAPDKQDLLDWLRQQPLLHYDETLGSSDGDYVGTALVHAGLPPQWSMDSARQYASEIEGVLRGEQYREFLAHMYGNQPDQWKESLVGWGRLRLMTNCFTRMRFCDANGRLDLQAKGAPGTQPAGFLPWYEITNRQSRESRIVFGHWSTLGLHQSENVVSLDTGCLWGERLTAMRLDGGGGIHSVASLGHLYPGETE
ncbi:MAG: symmetrical bis(5'-nucleosyl)-tetraphosphatase [Ectothiorhodospiraceae bacterium]|nr:symmetrical bis(5'-nucleosyl)-tetraphosphatase [Ectothiorhodospiraceae bacterium]